MPGLHELAHGLAGSAGALIGWLFRQDFFLLAVMLEIQAEKRVHFQWVAMSLAVI